MPDAKHLVGQVANLRPIGNRPAGSFDNARGKSARRHVGQPIMAAAAFLAALCEVAKGRVPANDQALHAR